VELTAHPNQYQVTKWRSFTSPHSILLHDVVFNQELGHNFTFSHYIVLTYSEHFLNFIFCSVLILQKDSSLEQTVNVCLLLRLIYVYLDQISFKYHDIALREILK
jgi:hypothetical protein